MWVRARLREGPASFLQHRHQVASARHLRAIRGHQPPPLHACSLPTAFKYTYSNSTTYKKPECGRNLPLGTTRRRVGGGWAGRGGGGCPTVMTRHTSPVSQSRKVSSRRGTLRCRHTSSACSSASTARTAATSSCPPPLAGTATRFIAASTSAPPAHTTATRYTLSHAPWRQHAAILVGGPAVAPPIWRQANIDRASDDNNINKNVFEINCVWRLYSCSFRNCSGCFLTASSPRSPGCSPRDTVPRAAPPRPHQLPGSVRCSNQQHSWLELRPRPRLVGRPDPLVSW